MGQAGRSNERLLYDPARPSSAVLLDSLPGSPQVTPSGGFETARPGRTRWLLLAPLISVVVVPLLVIWWIL